MKNRPVGSMSHLKRSQTNWELIVADRRWMGFNP